MVADQGPRTRRPSRLEPVRRTAPDPQARVNGWQALAIIALIAATAGWTTAILLATRDSGPTAAVETPAPSFAEEPTDDGTVPPVADTHDAPELEGTLPTELADTPLQVQSWTGDSVLSDDTWSTSLTSFLTSAGRLQEDLRVAQAYDPNQGLDGSIGAYRVPGIEAADIGDALVAAWKVDYPDMVVTTVTLDGHEVTKADFGEDTIDSYLLIRDDVVFDIETTDESIATAAVTAISALPPPPPAPSWSPRPSASPGGSLIAPAESAVPSAAGG